MEGKDLPIMLIDVEITMNLLPEKAGKATFTRVTHEIIMNAESAAEATKKLSEEIPEMVEKLTPLFPETSTEYPAGVSQVAEENQRLTRKLAKLEAENKMLKERLAESGVFRRILVEATRTTAYNQATQNLLAAQRGINNARR